MIKMNKGEISMKGSRMELMTDLASIINSFKEICPIELIKYAVKIGLAEDNTERDKITLDTVMEIDPIELCKQLAEMRKKSKRNGEINE